MAWPFVLDAMRVCVSLADGVVNDDEMRILFEMHSESLAVCRGDGECWSRVNPFCIDPFFLSPSFHGMTRSAKIYIVFLVAKVKCREENREREQSRCFHSFCCCCSCVFFGKKNQEEKPCNVANVLCGMAWYILVRTKMLIRIKREAMQKEVSKERVCIFHISLFPHIHKPVHNIFSCATNYKKIVTFFSVCLLVCFFKDSTILCCLSRFF